MAVNCSRVAVAAFMRISWNTVSPIIERVEKDLDINPNARVDDLPLGKYYLVETKTIDGFVLDDTPIEADLSYIDQNTKVVFAGMDVTNECQKVQITVMESFSYQCHLIRQSRWTSRASRYIRMSATRSQRILGKNSIMRLFQNMRKQRIRATKRLGRVPRSIMEIPIKRRTKRQHPFDN